MTQCDRPAHVEEDAVAETCLGLPWGPGEGTRICGFQGQLSTTLTQQLHAFQVPASSAIPAGQPERDLAHHQSGGREPLRAGRRTAHHPRLRLRGVATGNFATCEFDVPQSGHLVRARGPRRAPERSPTRSTRRSSPRLRGSRTGRRRRGGSVRQLPARSQCRPEGSGRATAAATSATATSTTTAPSSRRDLGIFKAAVPDVRGAARLRPARRHGWRRHGQRHGLQRLQDPGYLDVPGPSGFLPRPPPAPSRERSAATRVDGWLRG